MSNYVARLKTKLPDLPSEVLNDALDHLEACEKDPRYTIQMSTWHSASYDDTCHVCLAGAAMAGHGVKPDVSISAPYDVRGEKTQEKLLALDYARQGNLWPLLFACDIKDDGKFDKLLDRISALDIPHYPSEYFVDENPKDRAKFKREMRKIARWLAKAGI